MSDVAGTGDARRRASSLLVQEGLAADTQGDPRRAQSRYERAMQVDPTNPYVYLALARHSLDGGEPHRGLQYLERSEQLLASEEALSPGVEAHLDGLRGSAWIAMGRLDEGRALLARARQLAPKVWQDGRLAPDELQ